MPTIRNFADESALACFGRTVQELIGFLESECKVTLNWFNENRMIVIPEKSQAGHNYRSEKIESYKWKHQNWIQRN